MAVIMASGEVEIEDPDGHKFYILPHGTESVEADPIYKVKLNTSDLKKTLGSFFIDVSFKCYFFLFLSQTFLIATKILQT